MASKIQQQISFPVRKSSRQSKPSLVLQEANEQKSSSLLKAGSKNSNRDSTPQRTGSARRRQLECTSFSPCKRDSTPRRTASTRKNQELHTHSTSQRDCTPVRAARSKQKQSVTLSPFKSPSKRKAADLPSPPTPPKSPCKSLGRSSVQKSASRCPSPDICSEESDSEEEDLQLVPRRFVQPHNRCPDRTTPNKKNDARGTTPGLPTPNAMRELMSSSSRNTDAGDLSNKTSDGVAILRSPQRQRELKSPMKETVLPPPTPPQSPFVAAPLPHQSTSKENSRVLPRTPTKAEQLSRLSQNEAAFQTGCCHRLDLSSQNQRTCSEQSSFNSPTATPEKQPCKQILSPYKNRSCTPQKEQSGRLLSPCKSGTSMPPRQQPQREILSPKKVSTSPIKRLGSFQKISASPKKMMTLGNEENFSLKSPKLLPKLKLAKQDNSGYHRAKQSLHTAKPDHLVGREGEVKEISGFLQTHLDRGSAGSLYISGAPGTGKTAALLHIIDDFKAQYTCRIAYLNCMMVKDVSSVFRKLHSELSGKPATGRTSVKDMENLVTSSKNSMILVLDEIDQLDSRNQEVLYTIFEWPSLHHSKLILIGVANALDLTDRILPRLQAKPRCRPKLLHFAPYTRDQIHAIIKDRLEQTGDTIVENSAIQFCARKVAAVAGDMRKALDVCRRAVELAESEARSQTVLKVADCNSPSKQQPGPAVKKIGVSHVSKVMGEVYGSSVQAQQSEGVPLQQKLLVCTLLLAVKMGKFKEVLLGKLYEMYCKVCRRQQMSPVDQSEFHSLCVLLEARGVIGLKKAKETRLIKITLRQDEKELEHTLKDKVLVSAILADGLPK